MEEFEIKIFGERLKKLAKDDFGGVGKLAEKLKIDNLSIYTSGARDPRASTLFEFLKAGVDIIFLFTGKRGITVDEETNKRIKELEARIEKLESRALRAEDQRDELKEINEELEAKLMLVSVQSIQIDKAAKLKKHD